MTRLLRRVYLFARDYLDELPLVWSLARTRDCERNGGHRWKVSAWSINGQATRECSRCGCSEMIPTTTGTGTTWTITTESHLGASRRRGRGWSGS